MGRIVICGLSGCTIFFLIFGVGVGVGFIGCQKCFYFLSNFFYETFLILKKIQGITIINVGFSVKYPLFFVIF